MAEEIVNQIIAEIVAEDQMTQTLRGAQRKVKKFGKDIDKLNDVLSEQEKAALAAARADKKLAQSMKVAADEAKRLERQTEQTKKGIEGIAQGMGIGAISGERLSNSYLAVGAAAGTLVAGGLAILKSALDTYIATNAEAKASADRLTQAYKDLEVAAVDAVVGQDAMVEATDKMAVRIGILTASIKKLDEEADALSDTEKTLLDLTKQNAEAFLQTVNPVASLAVTVNNLTEAFDRYNGVAEKVDTDRIKRDAEARKKSNEEAQAEIDKYIAGERKKDAANQKRMASEAARKQKAAEAEAKRRAAEAKRAKAALEALAAKELSEVLNFERAITDAKRFAAVLDGIVEDIESMGLADIAQVQGTAFGFEDVTGAAPTAAGGVGGVLDEYADRSLGPAESETAMLMAETVDLDAALNDLAAGGIANVTSAVGGYIEALASGEEMTVGFGTALMISMGEMMQQVGAGMIALSTAKLIADNGFINPLAGLAVGAVLVAGGAALAGFGKGKAAQASKAGDAKSVANDVADVITARIGVANQRQDRQDTNVQVIIGERPIRDITVQSVNQAIANREINTLSLAGAAL